MEVEEQEEEEKQPKGKKVKQSKKHMPAEHLMIDGYDAKKPPGTPKDGGALLFGYKGSWAHTVYCTKSHVDAIRILKPVSSVLKMKEWPIALECKKVRDIVEASGLLGAVECSMTEIDKVLISAFVERYYAETDTFHLPCGEVVPTPEDVEVYTTLSASGKCVAENYKSSLDWDEFYRLTRECLGWDEAKTKVEWGKVAEYQNRSFTLVSLRKNFQGTLAREKKLFEETGKELDDDTIRHTATAYLLYLLGCVIFPNKTGGKVDANLLQLLEHLDKVKDYSWGTACLAYLLNELRSASRAHTAQIAGNLTIIQAFIYDHFPSIQRGKCRPGWDKGQPHGKKWYFEKGKTLKQVKDKKQDLVDLRILLDELSANDVVFDPHKEEFNLRTQVRFFFGGLWHPNGYVMYNPTRVMRQLGLRQEVPKTTIVSGYNDLDLKNCKATKVSITVAHKEPPTVEQWKKYELFCIRNRSHLAREGSECLEKYMDWYMNVSHPHVIRRDKDVQIETRVVSHLHVIRRDKDVQIETRVNGLDETPKDDYISILAAAPRGLQARVNKRCKIISKKIDEFLTVGEPERSTGFREVHELIQNLDNEEYAWRFGEKKPTAKKRSSANCSTNASGGGGDAGDNA